MGWSPRTFDNEHKLIKCHLKMYLTQNDKLGTRMAYFEKNVAKTVWLPDSLGEVAALTRPSSCFSEGERRGGK